MRGELFMPESVVRILEDWLLSDHLFLLQQLKNRIDMGG